MSLGCDEEPPESQQGHSTSPKGACVTWEGRQKPSGGLPGNSTGSTPFGVLASPREETRACYRCEDRTRFSDLIHESVLVV